MLKAVDTAKNSSADVEKDLISGIKSIALNQSKATTLMQTWMLRTRVLHVHWLM